MVGDRARGGDVLLRLADFGALCAAAPLALASARLVPGASAAPANAYALYSPLFTFSVLLWFASAWLLGVYEARARSPWFELARIAQALGAVAVAAAAILFLAKEQRASRATVVTFFAIAWGLLVLIRFAIRAVLRAMGRTGRRARYYAVVGTGRRAQQLVEAIRTHEWGLHLAGWIVEDSRSVPPGARPVLGSVGGMAQVLEEHVLDEVVFAVPRERMPRMEEAILTCEELGVPVRLPLDVVSQGRTRMTIGEVAGVPMLRFSRAPSDHLALAVKRAFDVVASALALLVLAPLLAATAIAIKLDSQGPVFFRQRRVGLNGRTFQILKFRSMYVDAETRLEQLRARNEMSGPVFKMADDPRVTRVGRLIRKASLDEFPQFWNVLQGDMSVVGPRPPLPAEVRQYRQWQRRRLSVKPGITCIWQVSGRNQIDFDRWMELDLEYIDDWSLWRDLHICLRTIPAVLTARGAR
jgi:exopolysaccharide biosynthesis polyprenyl glycosylphosphotransferase